MEPHIFELEVFLDVILGRNVITPLLKVLKHYLYTKGQIM